MTAKDIYLILNAFIRGKWTVSREWRPDGSKSQIKKRLSWSAFDTIGRQSIMIRPIKTAFFLMFDVS